ncbi:hypothetical protein THS27_15760 [Thalassospira sp. MCCC 1A01428]|nr:hypothetical protein THS27_15760 [Thalassospira sp. MCCC 1A01428]
MPVRFTKPDKGGSQHISAGCRRILFNGKTRCQRDFRCGDGLMSILFRNPAQSPYWDCKFTLIAPEKKHRHPA